ncbi:hypothetical protein AAV94_08760 [Lampropedia cohaerens]|uniref:Chemotaxis protein CheW n=1 Tax=Lampropedia cohaerens TaxID=1610491 RepID=A0A0U1PZ32_9BURK|nr:chemotaxis protein CheW [Lampropedia cohaerens]KKW67721.1 hypothetical protein AAV94_08760 [Lampropedia cohaerens]
MAVSHSCAQRTYLTFALAHERYAFDVVCVREICRYQAPTRIATAAPFVKGVVHLHGAIVPVLDLRLRFGCPRADYDDFTVMVVVEVDARMVAMVVDAVSDVVEVAQEAVQPVPDMQSVIHASCFTGLVEQPEGMLVLLDAQRLVREIDAWLDAHEQESAGAAAGG